MKHNIITFLLMATSIVNTTAQSIQSGVVKEYNERLEKTPLEYVEISISNAASTASDENGNFLLEFRTLKPGDKVNVRRIEKLGYEIFNKEALEQWYISRENTPFSIVMCKSERFKRIRDNYSRISSESYERQFRKEESLLADMLKNGQLKEVEYEKALKKLNENYDRQLENLDNYIDRFARIDLSELSAAEAEIIEFVQCGEIEKAIELYEQQNLEEKYKEQVLVKQKAKNVIDTLAIVQKQATISRDSLFASIKRKNEMLRLAGGKENYEKIRKSFKEVAITDTTYFDAVFEYAEFANSQNIFDDAIKYYKICLQLTDKNTEKCHLFEKIGIIQHKQNHFNEAEDALMASLNTAIILWEQDSINYRIYIARTKESIARLHYKMNNYNEANKFYLSALEHYYILYENQYDILKDIAEIQADLCEMYIDMRKFGDSDIFASIAEKSIATLYHDFPEKYRPEMARIKKAIGRNHRLFMRFDDAENAYKKSCELYLELFNNNPSAFRPQIADIYSKLSELYTKMHKFEDSKKYAKLALEQYDTLIIESNDAYLPSIANFRNQQANICREMRRFKEMKQYAKDFYEIINKLYTQYPDVYRFELCNANMNLAISYAMNNELNEAEKHFLYSNLLADTLCKKYPEAYLPTYLSTTKNLGSLYSMLHQYDKDSLYSSQAINISKKLYESNPTVYKETMADMLYNYGVYHIKIDKYEVAAQILSQSEILYNDLTDVYPKIFMESYRKVLRAIGLSQGNMDNKEAQLQYLFKAYEKATILFKEDPDVYLKDYTQCLNDLAFFYQENNELEKSKSYYKESIELTRKLYNENPEAYALDMTEMLMTYALMFLQTKDYEKAYEIQKEATSIIEPLYEKYPQRILFTMALCYDMEAYLLYIYFIEDDKAEELYLKALPLFTSALEKYPSAKGNIINSRNILTDIYINKGEFSKAIEQMEAVLAMEPDNEIAIKNKKKLETQ